MTLHPIPGAADYYALCDEGHVWSSYDRYAGGTRVRIVNGVRWRRLKPSKKEEAYTLITVDGRKMSRARKSLCRLVFGRVPLPPSTVPAHKVQTKERQRSDAERDRGIRHIMRILDAVGRDGAMALLDVDEDTLRRAGVGLVVIEGAAELARRCEAGEVERWARPARRARLDGYAMARGEDMGVSA